MHEIPVTGPADTPGMLLARASGRRHMAQTPNRLVGYLVGFLVIAAPLAMIAWHELSEVLMGHVTTVRLLVGVGALAALGALATALARFMEGDSR